MDQRTRRTELIGRDDEISRLEAALSNDAVRAVTVHGEPGIGKTRLLAELAGRADGEHALVLEGCGDEVEADVPFSVFRDAMDDYVASMHPRELRPGYELGRVLPSAMPKGEPAVREEAPVSEERYRSHQAVRALLERLASQRRVVLILDDVHWADAASLELLGHLLRHPPRGRALIAIGHRGSQPPPILAAPLATAERAGRVERVGLDGLDRGEADLLLGAAITGARRAEILDECGGNPFYLEQLSRGDLHPGPGASLTRAGLPAAIAASIAAEVKELGDDAALLRGGAVVGEPFELELAAAAAGLTETSALSAVDTIVASGLIRATDSPRRFRFRHPIIRRAVYESTPEGWRLGAHERVAIALAEQGAPPTARAPHLERCARVGDESAIADLTAAAEAASPRAPAAAAHWYEIAIGLLTDEEDPRQLALLGAQARALAACGEYERALAAMDRVLDAIPPEEVGLRARVVSSAGRVMQLIGRHGEANGELRAALEALPADAPEASSLRLQLAGDSFFEGDFATTDTLISEALQSARAHDERPVVAAAAGLRSAGLYMHDRAPEARVALTEALELIAGLSDEELAEHLPSHTWTALGAISLERFADAAALLDRCEAVALATGKGHLPALIRTNRALALIWTGRHGEAGALLDDAIDASILTKNPIFLSWALALQAWATLIGGDIVAATRIAEESAATEGFGNDPMSATAACYIGEALLASGAAARARALVLEANGGRELPLVERGFRARPYELLTRAELTEGATAAAAEWAALAEQAAAGMEIRGRDADAARARAELELAKGDPTAAAEAAQRAASAAGAAGLPIDAARGRILLGRALAASGDGEGAATELQAARSQLDEVGAAHHRDEAARELRKLGVRVPRPARGDDGALSPREREIATLVAAGRRNAEIAEALFLSPRTVEGHLNRAFRKLGVSSRTELVARIGNGDG